MKTYRCDGLVPNCRVTFAGDDDQIQDMAVKHAQRDHGFTDITDAHLAQIRANIT
ncbi:MAG TPA: DUF1059 domain-containing protein [Nocardioidaceae bacterium]|jgi:predicted small metal-binding protein|nr:DUF1059 domain-containing protein [Nocardioidaceae bacterium]